MIYIVSFFRRIKFKSAFNFSFIIALGSLVVTRQLDTAIFTLTTSVFIFQFVSKLVNWWDRSKKTDLPCPMCSYEHSVLLYPSKKKPSDKNSLGSYACSSFDHGKYPDIRFCPICKNGFLSHLISKDRNDVINSGFKMYESVIDSTYIENIKSRYKTYENIIQKYNPYFKNKNILEIGSYYGVFINEVQSIAKSFTGIEPSTHGCKYIKDKYPHINVINSNLENAIANNLLENKKFDTIVLWDVIEHLSSPIDTLRSLNKFLNNGGHVIFSTINIESTFSIVLGPLWPWFMDMHYYYFSDRGYVDMLHRSGYVIKAHHHFKYFVSIAYFIQKVTSLIFGIQLSNKNLLSKLNMSIPIQLGDTVLVIGKKEMLAN